MDELTIAIEGEKRTARIAEEAMTRWRCNTTANNLFAEARDAFRASNETEGRRLLEYAQQAEHGRSQA